MSLVMVELPFHLEDKIFEIQFDTKDNVSKIISYFPFSESEQSDVLSVLNKESFDGFHSIFIDKITEEEWNNTKDQIKNKFKDELFDIDKIS